MAETDVVAVLASTLSCTYWPTFPDNSRTGLNNSAFAFLGSCDGLSDSRSVSTESVQINTDRRLSATAKDVRSRSNSAVPSTTEHSRSTFSCGRTVTLPSRPEVAELQNRKLEAVDRRRTETPYKPLYAADVARNTGTAAEHAAQTRRCSVKDGITITGYW